MASCIPNYTSCKAGTKFGHEWHTPRCCQQAPQERDRSKEQKHTLQKAGGKVWHNLRTEITQLIYFPRAGSHRCPTSKSQRTPNRSPGVNSSRRAQVHQHPPPGARSPPNPPGRTGTERLKQNFSISSFSTFPEQRKKQIQML